MLHAEKLEYYSKKMDWLALVDGLDYFPQSFAKVDAFSIVDCGPLYLSNSLLAVRAETRARSKVSAALSITALSINSLGSHPSRFFV